MIIDRFLQSLWFKRVNTMRIERPKRLHLFETVQQPQCHNLPCTLYIVDRRRTAQHAHARQLIGLHQHHSFIESVFATNTAAGAWHPQPSEA